MRIVPILSLAVFLGTCGAAAAIEERENAVADNGQAYGEIARGHYLSILGDCGGCHTRSGGAPFAGGTPVETPFGLLLAPNITPDRQTGIGAWSDDEFVRAVQEGRSDHGEHLYPAMPYTYYTKMPRNDVLAIRAYLNAIDPVQNEVEANQLPFPFNIRASMAAWNTLFFHPGQFKPDPNKPAAWNRGAYIVEGPGHCGVCHTTKNFLGGDETSHVLQGAALQGWYSPNLTGDPRAGLGSWKADDIVKYLRSGQNRISAASGPMAEVIADSTSQMTDADLKAIATYLKDQPAAAASDQKVDGQASAMHAGEAIYADNCAACHVGNGAGMPGLFPALKNSPIVQSADPTTLIRVVLHGTQNVATSDAPTGASMPAFGWKLSDQQTAAVITYMRNAWGNGASAVDAGKVHGLR